MPFPCSTDSEHEADETFTVTLNNARNATLRDAVGIATITDDDPTEPAPPPSPPPALSIDDLTVAENAGQALFTVSLSKHSNATVTVAYATSDGSAQAGFDYTPASGSLTFQPGDTAYTIAIPVLDDSEQEADETFTVTLNNARNATLSDPVGTAIITDDDPTEPAPPPSPPPALSIDDLTVAENAGQALFTVSLSKQSVTTVSVAYATFDGSAQAGSDYTRASGSLTFQPGDTAYTIAVPVLDDSEHEADETFFVTLNNARNATLRDAVGIATITDDDPAEPPPPPPPPPVLSIDDLTVAENAGQALFTVSLSKHSNATVTVAYATSDGSAQAGSDYTAATGSLTFQPGATAYTIATPVLDDSEQEADETFFVTLSDPRNATLTDPVATATITDDDPAEPPPPPPPALSIDDLTVAEDAGRALFTVSLSKHSNTTVTVAYATSDGSAQAGSDYTAATGSLTFQPGATAYTIAVPVLDDSEHEADETFFVTLSDPRNATLTDPVATATITDDDPAEPPPPPPALSIDDLTVAEDAGRALFTVSLSKHSNTTVTVAYATSDGSAQAGSDYTAATGSLTFQPGATAYTIAVPVLDDSEHEADETFSVTLSDPRNATLSQGCGHRHHHRHRAPRGHGLLWCQDIHRRGGRVRRGGRYSQCTSRPSGCDSGHPCARRRRCSERLFGGPGQRALRFVRDAQDLQRRGGGGRAGG